MSETTQPAPARGLDVFVRAGCGACHTFTPAGSASTRGPDLDRVAQENEEVSLRESIVAPDADIAVGFEAGLMPSDYAERLTEEELDGLVAFLLDIEG